jgi:hypothetical protein
MAEISQANAVSPRSDWGSRMDERSDNMIC